MTDQNLTHEVLQGYVDQGLLLSRDHPNLPLTVFNYSSAAMIDDHWDEVTKQCRGLVLDQANQVIARPFQKFFNIEQNRHTPTSNFTVTDKVDGSLIILFYYQGQWVVCSKGSFESDHAVKARELIEQYYSIEHLDRAYTYLLEVIWPGNRIVVNYNGWQGLVYLSAIHTESGEERANQLSDPQIHYAGFDVVKSYEFNDYTAIKNLNWNNHEGFVVTFITDNNLVYDRCKVKFEDYVRLHKLLTQLNKQDVWQQLADNEGQLPAEFLDLIPDELYTELMQVATELKAQFQTYWELNYQFFYKINNRETRKDFAHAVKLYCGQPAYPYTLKSAQFLLRDGKFDQAKQKCWQAVKPYKEPIV